jgi:hypothetical protein
MNHYNCIYYWKHKEIKGYEYIGKAKDLNKRTQQHLNNKSNKNIHYISFDKLFTNTNEWNLKILAENLPEEILDTTEAYYIQAYKTDEIGLNFTQGNKITIHEKERGKLRTTEDKNYNKNNTSNLSEMEIKLKNTIKTNEKDILNFIASYEEIKKNGPKKLFHAIQNTIIESKNLKPLFFKNEIIKKKHIHYTQSEKLQINPVTIRYVIFDIQLEDAKKAIKEALENDNVSDKEKEMIRNLLKNTIYEKIFIETENKQEEIIQTKHEINEILEEKKSGCYVATCVYGSYEHEKVKTLRNYRDTKLSKNYLGKIFIKTYYTISPTIVKYLGENKLFKKINKKILDKIITKIK